VEKERSGDKRTEWKKETREDRKVSIEELSERRQRRVQNNEAREDETR